MRILQLALLATALMSATSACAPGKTAESALASYTVIDGQASQLRADFNRKVGTIRLLFVVDPICPGCLRGLADMNRDLLRGTTDPRLQVFVVHEPVLGVARYIPWLRIAGGRDVQKAEQLIQNPNVHHYWNRSGAFGRVLSRGVGLKNTDGQVYAWDVWMIYGPEAKWVGAEPPKPQLLMQQLWAIPDSPQFPRLNTHVFAQRVRTLLAHLSPSTGAPALARQAPR